MLFPDFRRGLSEMVRVTRPGGTVFLVTFGPIQKVEFIGMFIGAVQEVVPGFTGLSPDTPPLPFQVSDEGVLQQRMEAAGLSNVQVEPLIHKLSFHSGKEMWNWVTSSNPIVNQMISGLDDRQKNQVVQILEERIRERTGGQAPGLLEVAVNIGIGEKVK
jgi:ubiquinone/menaquinone biosynthesis C-methylase UbiE